MEGWIELSSYSLLAALLGGLATALSFWGVGRLACGRFLAGVPDFARLPGECVAGVILMGLLVQVLAMCDVSNSGAMRALWIAGGAAGVISLAQSVRAALVRKGASARDSRVGLDGDATARDSPSTAHARALLNWYWAPAALMAVALLLAGAAPESRSDEVAYHALVSARPLVDGGLRFYALPWEASVIPQMLWHFALTPLYAISGAAAAGVASASLAIVLAFAVGRLVQWVTQSAPAGAVAAFITLAGGYSIVFFTTAGPHAFGYLAVFVAVTAVGWSDEIRAAAGTQPYGHIVALGCAGAVASKVTMLPVAAIISVLALMDIRRDVLTPAGHRLRTAVWIVLVPGVCLLLPITWTWAAAGSPLGALTARMFHAPPFDPESLSAYEGTRELFSNNFGWRFEAAYWNLPLVAGVLLSLWLEPSRQRRLRWWLIGGCQALLIVFFLPHEIRHFGGIQYPLMASGFAAVLGRARAASRARIVAVGAVAAVPWALFVLWVATIYVPLASGRMTATEFLRRYSGLQSDYEALDKTLPPDASILIGRSRSDPMQYAWYSRPPVYYAPRRILFGTSEIGGRDHLYLLYLATGAAGTHGAIPFDPWLPAGYSLGRCVYSNPEARFYPSRTPGGNAGLARLDVFELLRH